MSNENAAAAMDKLVKELNKREFDRGYEKGMEDAWEMAKRIVLNPAALKDAYTVNELRGIFGKSNNIVDILLNNSPKEAKEKIENYIQKKNSEFHVGDEIKYKDGSFNKGVIIDIRPGDFGSILYRVLFENARTEPLYEDAIYSEFDKTGRHFDEVEILLNKLRG